MNNLACNRVQRPVVKKVKKQSKDELDRLKQAEKKRRRLEKALANSAAIRSELEKKKQKKKEEEQQRLDAEGAAIAEAVALHVLLGDESDEACKVVQNGDEDFDLWDHFSSDNFFTGAMGATLLGQVGPECSHERIGRAYDASGSRLKWGGFGASDWTFSSGFYGGNWHGKDITYGGWAPPEFSAGSAAALAISSLQITEDGHVASFS